MNVPQRFARLVTDLVTRQPRLWALFRRPLGRMFDAMAPQWEQRRVTEIYLAALRAGLDRVAGEPARALDLGTGTGAAARTIAARWPAAEVTGADLSPRMIEQARANASSPRERYEVADAAALPFADASFDLVTLSNMIPFYDELARVTAPGGQVVIAFSRGSQTPIWVPLERMRAELERRGFTHVAEINEGEGRVLLAVKGGVS
jgi:ubiquinone/menaquinone biosynthesis C-methylase UbiE